MVDVIGVSVMYGPDGWCDRYLGTDWWTEFYGTWRSSRGQLSIVLSAVTIIIIIYLLIMQLIVK